METKLTHSTETLARRSLKLGMISWGVLSIIAVIGFLMERFPYTGDSKLIFVGLTLVGVVLWCNVLFLLRISIWQQPYPVRVPPMFFSSPKR